MNKAWRRQSSAEWAARAVTDFCDKNRAWTTGWLRLRARSDAHFKEAVTEAAALHARGELFAEHTTPEPAEEGLPVWAMAEAAGDEDDAPMSDAPAPPEVELITMPRAAASAPLTSNLERCIAASVKQRWTAVTPPKHCHLIFPESDGRRPGMGFARDAFTYLISSTSSQRSQNFYGYVSTFKQYLRQKKGVAKKLILTIRAIIFGQNRLTWLQVISMEQRGGAAIGTTSVPLRKPLRTALCQRRRALHHCEDPDRS